MEPSTTEYKFKKGDQVIITRVDESYRKSPWYHEYIKMIGTVSTIKGIENGNYELCVKRNPIWKESELEPAKNQIVRNILNDL